eukprot:scaffold327227_cov48-Prasinocladus_malaysianus.AAC.1
MPQHLRGYVRQGISHRFRSRSGGSAGLRSICRVQRSGRRPLAAGPVWREGRSHLDRQHRQRLKPGAKDKLCEPWPPPFAITRSLHAAHS